MKTLKIRYYATDNRTTPYFVLRVEQKRWWGVGGIRILGGIGEASIPGLKYVLYWVLMHFISDFTNFW